MKTTTKLGLAALAAAAGAYFLFGKDGAKNRAKMQSWMLKAKADVMDDIEKAKDLTKESYEAIIAKAEAKYKKVKNVEEAEVEKLMKKLRSQWSNIKKEMAPVVTKAKKVATQAKKSAKTVKKTIKTEAKKVSDQAA